MLQRSRSRPSQLSRRGGGTHPIDVHIGSRIRLRRATLGLSQATLGEAIGITFQQVQKYERGANRIGAGRLLEVARVLDVPIGFFYDDIDPAQAPAILAGSAEPARATPDRDPLQQPETLELVRAYTEITDTKIRLHLLQLAKALSATDKGRPVAEAMSRPRGGRRRKVPTDPSL
jgi:transcriptional regulator with XRE-family HTH domain